MSAAAAFSSLIPLFVVTAMRRAEARIHRQLAEAKAFTAESAIELPLGRAMDRRRLAGLVEGGAVRVTPNRRHFLDADGWADYQRRRRRRVQLALAVVVALVGIVFAVAWMMTR